LVFLSALNYDARSTTHQICIVVFIRGCQWPYNVKNNAIHPPFDLYTLFLVTKTARMRWVEYVAKLTK